VTKREEDAAYSLLGLFDVYMPLIYGEGRENAFIRLREEIEKSLKGGITCIASHAASKYRESAPEVFCNIPFRRDPHFVGREALLDQIRGKMLCASVLRGARWPWRRWVSGITS